MPTAALHSYFWDGDSGGGTPLDPGDAALAGAYAYWFDHSVMGMNFVPLNIPRLRAAIRLLLKRS